MRIKLLNICKGIIIGFQEIVILLYCINIGNGDRRRASQGFQIIIGPIGARDTCSLIPKRSFSGARFFGSRDFSIFCINIT